MTDDVSRLSYEAMPVEDLALADLASWERLAGNAGTWASPYLHPGYARAVAATKGGVWAGLARRDGQLVGALPFDRDGRRAAPVGYPTNDLFGAVGELGAFDLLPFMATVGIRAFRFENVPTEQVAFAPYARRHDQSPFMDVSGGFDAYRGRLSSSGLRRLSDVDRCARRAEQTFGELRLVHDRDPGTLAQLIQMKTAQYVATGHGDFFANGWASDLLRNLLATQEPGFGGVLSALYAGDRLLAAHFGIRTERVLHWWYPAYDPAAAPFSPGWLLLVRMAAAGTERGWERIDLGRGTEDYKRRAMTGTYSLMAGEVETRRSVRAWGVVNRLGRAGLRRTPLASPARRLVRRLRPRGGPNGRP
ncbi:MAG: GNAT family N-acetyltransferase [Acidimicrobiales bacterium]